MKRTPLYPLHIAADARMVPFAGYEMPIEYDGITLEHMAVRNSAGLFDVSHMGEFWVKGPNAMRFLQRITSNDVSQLAPGKIQYSCLPNGRGGIIDDLLVYQYEDEKYMLVVNASNIQKDWDWCLQHKMEGVELENASDQISLLAVQGPKAEEILKELTPIDLSSMHPYSFVTGEMAGIAEVIISKTGYTGAGGFELYVDNRDAVKLWQKIMKAGESYGLIPAGLGARDTLRLEMGFCLYGNDIDETTSPIEAGLGWITKLTDEKAFADKELLQDQKVNGTERILKGFKMGQKAIPRQGYTLLNAQGEEIGVVTSGTMSPVLKEGIGMGYVQKKYASVGTPIFVAIRNRNVPAQITKTPFI